MLTPLLQDGCHAKPWLRELLRLCVFLLVKRTGDIADKVTHLEGVEAGELFELF